MWWPFFLENINPSILHTSFCPPPPAWSHLRLRWSTSMTVPKLRLSSLMTSAADLRGGRGGQVQCWTQEDGYQGWAAPASSVRTSKAECRSKVSSTRPQAAPLVISVFYWFTMSSNGSLLTTQSCNFMFLNENTMIDWLTQLSQLLQIPQLLI